MELVLNFVGPQIQKCPSNVSHFFLVFLTIDCTVHTSTFFVYFSFHCDYLFIINSIKRIYSDPFHLKQSKVNIFVLFQSSESFVKTNLDVTDSETFSYFMIIIFLSSSFEFQIIFHSVLTIQLPSCCSRTQDYVLSHA